MQQEVKRRNLPQADRLSVLTAMILLAYALARFIDIPGREIGFQLPGVYISFELNIQLIIALLVAGMTASGTSQILRHHPNIGSEPTIGHWLLPAFTALVIGLPLYQLPSGPVWWLGYILGGALLMLVVLAEYITLDEEDEFYIPAAIGLTTVSFAIFLTLSIALRIAGTRLILILPVLMIAAGLVCLRTLHLRLHERWQYTNAILLSLIIGQLAAALHYWRISPIAYGLALLAPAYSLMVYLGNIAEGESPRKALVEPAVIAVVIWSAAFLI
jgi:hypothetical protein